MAVWVFEERLSAGPTAVAAAALGIVVGGAGIAVLARSPSLVALGGRLAAGQSEP